MVTAAQQRRLAAVEEALKPCIRCLDRAIANTKPQIHARDPEVIALIRKLGGRQGPDDPEGDRQVIEQATESLARLETRKSWVLRTFPASKRRLSCPECERVKIEDADIACLIRACEKTAGNREPGWDEFHPDPEAANSGQHRPDD